MEKPRRSLLMMMSGATLGACARTLPAARSATPPESELGEVTPVEDLMNEHGILRRVLLVYAEGSRRVRAREALDPSLIHRAAAVIQTVIEQHHERDEERFVFPVLQHDAKVGSLITVLLAQHVRGREVTAEILRLSALGPSADSDSATRLADLCDAFARMYHPHAAHEDTVVFPALRLALGRHSLWELGERMESAESEGDEEATRHAMLDLHELDLALGLADLSRFTPAPVT